MEGNQPEKRISTGAISATVWKNNGVAKSGQAFEMHSITLERRYKDSAGNWKSTNSLRVNDLPKAVLVLEEAFRHLVLSTNNTKTPQFNGGETAAAAPAAV